MGIRPGQASISQTGVLEKIELYQSDALYNQKAYISYCYINNQAFVIEGHHTTIANVIFFGYLNTGPNMGQICDVLPSTVLVKSWLDLLIYD